MLQCLQVRTWIDHVTNQDQIWLILRFRHVYTWIKYVTKQNWLQLPQLLCLLKCIAVLDWKCFQSCCYSSRVIIENSWKYASHSQIVNIQEYLAKNSIYAHASKKFVNCERIPACSLGCFCVLTEFLPLHFLKNVAKIRKVTILSLLTLNSDKVVVRLSLLFYIFI